MEDDRLYSFCVDPETGKETWYGRCQICSSLKKIRPGRARSGGRFYCSLKCYGVDLKDPTSALSRARDAALIANFGPEKLSSQKVKDKKRASSLEKYGVDHPSKSLEVKNKQITTMLDRHGVINPGQLEDVIHRREQTLMNKYGVSNPMHVPEFKAKQEATNLERYGSPSSMGNDVVRAKRAATNMELYGVAEPLSSADVIRKRETTNLERYGVRCPAQDPNIQRKTVATILAKGDERFRSSEEREMEIWLREVFGSDDVFIGDNWIARQSIDIYVRSLRLHIQVDGVFWHGLRENLSRPDFILRKMERDKTLNEWFYTHAKDGFKLFRINDLQWNNVVRCSEHRNLEQIIRTIPVGVSLYAGFPGYSS